jgi:hypothetical protein
LASIRSSVSWFQQLASGERLPGRQGELGGAVGAAHPRPVDRDPAAAEGDLAGLGAVADRCSVGVVAALGAGQPLNVGLQEAVQHADSVGRRHNSATSAVSVTGLV